ncbi:MAG: hypothetical protein JW781_02665 [Deltaproteobacteria bacterium]|nr:hypothetical protein [Candidatus Anaeroferrophillacea bacterium]
MWSLIIPAEECVSITPSDAANLTNPIRGLYVGVSGDVKIVDMRGNTITFAGLAAGIIHPIRAVKVFDTDTTATDIVGVL